MEKKAVKAIKIPVFDVIKPKIAPNKSCSYFDVIRLSEKNENIPEISLRMMLLQRGLVVKRRSFPCWYFEIAVGKHSVAHRFFFCIEGTEEAYIDGLEWFSKTIKVLKDAFSGIDGNVEMIV